MSCFSGGDVEYKIVVAMLAVSKCNCVSMSSYTKIDWVKHGSCFPVTVAESASEVSDFCTSVPPKNHKRLVNNKTKTFGYILLIAFVLNVTLRV